MQKKFAVKTGMAHIIKLLKLVCIFAIGAVAIHDVVTREKRLLGSELAFVHFYVSGQSHSVTDCIFAHIYC